MKHFSFFYPKSVTLKVFCFTFIFIALIGLQGWGQTIKTAKTGNWSTDATWTPSGVPASNDPVIIPTGVTITMDVDATCEGVTTGTATGTATIEGSKTLTTGVLTISSGTGNNADVLFSIGNGTTLNCTSIIRIQGGGNATEKLSIYGTLKNSGTTSALDAFTCGSSSIIEYNGTEQTVYPTTYNNLTLSGSGKKTMQSATTVNGNVTIEEGITLDEAGIQMTLGSGSILEVNGILDFTSSTGLIRTGKDQSATLTMGPNGIIRTVDDLGLGPLTNASLQNNGTGSWTTSSLNTNGTVEYYRTSAQTVTARTYNNLTLSGSGAKTTTGVKVNGILSMEGTATASASPTYTESTSSLVYNGSAQQTAGIEWLATMTRPITITNTLGVNTNGSKVVNTTLTVNGILIPGATHVISGTGTLTGTGTVKVTKTTATADLATQYTIPKTLTNLTIDYSGAGDQTVNALTYNNLTTSGTGVKTIAATSAVTVNGNLNVANGSTLTIASTGASATGSLIVYGSASGTGTVKVQRYLPTNDWHLISSPVSGQALGAFCTANNIQFDDTDKTYDLGPYNETTDVWDYPYISSTTASFDMAKGYSTERTLATGPEGPGLSTFTGTGIYTGDQNIAMARAGYGWNCIGNPYTSAISASDFISYNGPGTGNQDQLDETYSTIYIWDNAQTQYQPISFFAGMTHIAVGQGFIVKAKTGGGTAYFKTSMQSHQNGAIFKDAEIPWPAVTLKAEAGDFRCTTLINFNEAMTTGLDPTYDAGMFKGNPNIALYSRLASGDNPVDFSVQSLPPSQTVSYRIPVGLDLPDGGEVSFTAETMNLSTGNKMILEDVQSQTFTDLGAEGAKYTTVVAAKTSGTGRFYLHTGENSVTAVRSLAKPDFTVFTRDRIITINGEANEATSFNLYNLEGKQFVNLRARKMNQNTIDASGFPSGVYLLRINNKGRQQVAKLVLMN